LETNQTLYQGESRAIQLTLLDQDNNAFTPASATYYTTDIDGTVIKASMDATLSTNTITGSAGITITDTPGNYYMIWRIIDSDGHIYYHRTYIQVLTLLPD